MIASNRTPSIFVNNLNDFEPVTGDHTLLAFTISYAK